MTEAGWQRSTSTEALYAQVYRRMSPPQARLWGSACVPAAYALGLPPLLRAAVEVTEASADGLAGPDAVGRARKKAEAACRSAEEDSPAHFFALAALRLTDDGSLPHYAYHVPFFLQKAVAATLG